MFTSSIPHYDRIYAWKDYAADARQVLALVTRFGRPQSRTLLDVACGTGKHLEQLRSAFEVAGSDLSPGMLRLASERLAGVPLTGGDYRSLDLGRRFDVVTCLFSSIGYCLSEEDLGAAWRSFARHLAPGGVAIVEPWFAPGDVQDGHVALRVIDDPDLKLVRMSTTRVDGRRSVLDMHHLVGTAEGTRHFVERHEVASWSAAEMEAAIRAAGLAPHWVPDGLPRGAWLGCAPPES